MEIVFDFLDPVRLQHRDSLEVWFFFRPSVRPLAMHFGKKEGNDAWRTGKAPVGT